MKSCLTIGLALAAFGLSSFADARPPTVMNSPGYDARLQESRKALGNPPAAAEPATSPASKPRRAKKKRAH